MSLDPCLCGLARLRGPPQEHFYLLGQQDEQVPACSPSTALASPGTCRGSCARHRSAWPQAWAAATRARHERSETMWLKVLYVETSNAVVQSSLLYVCSLWSVIRRASETGITSCSAVNQHIIQCVVLYHVLICHTMAWIMIPYVCMLIITE